MRNHVFGKVKKKSGKNLEFRYMKLIKTLMEHILQSYLCLLI
nr:MAG TPA: hypothetical protein [Caudoviricetes sp.]